MALNPKSVMAIGLGIIFLAAVLPVAFNTFFTADTSSWDAGTVALWAIIPLAVIALVIYNYTGTSGKGS